MKQHSLNTACYAFIFIALSSFLPKEKTASYPDYRKMGFSQPTAFIYHVVHKTLYTTWEDTVGLFCSDKIFSSERAMTITEWKFLAGDNTGALWPDMSKHPTLANTEGTVTADSMLFLHPARACYSELQCCPYPYFENRPEWTCEFEVGEAWGAGPLFPIKGTEKFYMKYKRIEGRTDFETPIGKLSCSRVDATCTSTLGVSTATYYLHEVYGLVHFSVSALDKEFFEFSMLKKIEGRPEISKIYHDFVYGMPMPDIQQLMKEHQENK